MTVATKGALLGALLWFLHPPEPPAGARYLASQFRCAPFSETIQSSVRAESGTASVADKAGRVGLVFLTARDSTAGILVEAWYDSLAVWRETSLGREAPDTEGFLGGRFRGLLTGDGRYRSIKDPFVPDDVAQVADLASAMDEFLPRLPPIVLEVGRDWRDSTTTITRDPDVRQQGQLFQRYRWTSSARKGERYDITDSAAVILDQVVKEQGQLLFSPTLGPLSWSRAVTVAARVPATGGVKRVLHSTVEQRIDVVRRFDLAGQCGGAGAAQ